MPKTVSLLALACLLSSPWTARGGEGCQIVGEIIVESVKAGAMAKCAVSADPLACAIAGAAQSVAATGVAKKGITKGCEWTVQKAGKVVRFIAKAKAGDTAKLKAAEKELGNINEVRWRERAP